MKEEDREREEFTSEAEELLDTLSRDLVDFESQGQNVRPELVNKIFREVHSLKGLAGMLGFGEIADLSHNLEDMLDRLRMGKIPINRDLIDLLYDSVDSLNRLVIAINDPSLQGLVDVTKLASRIHQTITAQPVQQHQDPFADLTLEEKTKKSLTEYEEHRLLENVKQGKHILSIEVAFDFSEFDEKLRALTSRLSEIVTAGEAHRGKIRRTPANVKLIETFGGLLPTEVVALPIMHANRTIGILYGDNAENRAPIDNMTGLEIFLSQAGYAFGNAVFAIEKSGGSQESL